MMSRASDLVAAAPRSFLFVPGDRPERFDKATASGSDAVILDLEDAVAPQNRSQATDNIRQWLLSRPADGGQDGPQLWVRVPTPDEVTPELCDLAQIPALTGYIVPKVERPGQVSCWSVPVVALIESAMGLLDAADIAANAGQNLVGMALGGEDLALSLQCEPNAAGLTAPAAQLLVVARAYGRLAYVCPGSIAQFRDLDAWRQTLHHGKALGSDGAFCIHPAQVGPANQIFAPSADDVAAARRVVEAFEESMARGQAAVQLDGNMLDRPVVERSRRLVERARQYGLI